MSPLDALRRPAYTGENRCWPCAAVNLLLVAVVAAIAGSLRAPLAPVVLLGGGLLVYLRGYVVPGTPRFAPRLVDPLPVDVGPEKPVGSDSIADGVDPANSGTPVNGGESPDEEDSPGEEDSAEASAPMDPEASATMDPEAVIATLSGAGVLVADGDDLSPTDAYRESFEARMADLRSLTETELAERAAAAAAGAPTAEVHGDRILLVGDRDVRLSRAVAIAETAAVETLAGFDVPPAVRTAAAEPLRTLVRTCPVCGGDVSETTLRLCCGGPGGTHKRPDRPVLACESCDTVVFEFEADST